MKNGVVPTSTSAPRRSRDTSLTRTGRGSAVRDDETRPGGVEARMPSNEAFRQHPVGHSYFNRYPGEKCIDEWLSKWGRTTTTIPVESFALVGAFGVSDVEYGYLDVRVGEFRAE